ncbi:MAG: tRNA (guanosine(37)-N1)-methyltransferase TrmD [Betaproteobacteria bacterium TMED156]|nr:MAG: tRNA (guanosine(37)-N1)-methyltransferase TrmD [Betaproteobacteria bacterium TMED156]|tara:strand:- start:2237 stop:3019 length:783 start_codon:yes stop_codon:yes gene_type:complete
MQFDIVTIFPELFKTLTKVGVFGKAYNKGIFKLSCWNPRDFVNSAHSEIDDRPYGGGPGMVMMAQPLRSTLLAIKSTINKNSKNKVVLFSPIGKKIEQDLVEEFVTMDHQNMQFSLICGRYEGVDQRFVDLYVDEIWSLGDFVNTGGELAAMVFMDALIRRLPEALGNDQSSVQDSFINGLLDHPQYSRPEIFESISVPDVLLSGHHAKIKLWRRRQALRTTVNYRPDLIIKARSSGFLSQDDEDWIVKLEKKSSKEDER